MVTVPCQSRHHPFHCGARFRNLGPQQPALSACSGRGIELHGDECEIVVTDILQVMHQGGSRREVREVFRIAGLAGDGHASPVVKPLKARAICENSPKQGRSWRCAGMRSPGASRRCQTRIAAESSACSVPMRPFRRPDRIFSAARVMPQPLATPGSHCSQPPFPRRALWDRSWPAADLRETAAAGPCWQ